LRIVIVVVSFRLEHNAYRCAGITLAIIILVPGHSRACVADSSVLQNVHIRNSQRLYGMGRRPRPRVEKEFPGTVGPCFELAPDGKRIMVLKPIELPAEHVTLLLNWFDEVRRRMPLSAK
jgi:hypothetical protein